MEDRTKAIPKVGKHLLAITCGLHHVRKHSISVSADLPYSAFVFLRRLLTQPQRSQSYRGLASFAGAIKGLDRFDRLARGESNQLDPTGGLPHRNGLSKISWFQRVAPAVAVAGATVVAVDIFRPRDFERCRGIRTTDQGQCIDILPDSED